MQHQATRERGTWSSERGIALPVSLLVLLLLSVLAAGILFVSNQEILAASNYRILSQSAYVAEAGIQRGIEWLSNTYPTLPGTNNVANFNTACYPTVPAGAACDSGPVLLAGITTSNASYPIAAVQDNFVGGLSQQAVKGGTLQGSYSVDAQLVSVEQVLTGIFPPYQVNTKEKWLLNARGAIGGGTLDAAVTATATLQKLFRSYFSDALYGICSVQRVAGTSRTDSYDSDVGPYGGANQQNSQAGVGSNGRVTTEGTATQIGGDVTFGPGNPPTCAAGIAASVNPVVVTGTVQAAPPRTFPALPPFPSPGGPDVAVGGTQIRVLAAGNWGQVAVSGQGTLVLNGTADANTPAVYNFENISLTGGTTVIQVNPPGSNVLINVRGTTIVPAPSGDCADTGLYLAGQGIFSGNPPPPPRTVTLNYYGANCMVIAGGSNISALIYAPNGNVMLGGNGNFYGAVVSNNNQLYGSRAIHYDRSLQDERGTLTPLQIISFSRPKF